jgi:transcriptional regulator of arginine metabolism
MKVARQTRILQLIEEHAVEKQEELVDLLKKDGYDVTQTTVSRDIRELKLFKVLDADGVYKYAISESDPDHFETRISSVFRHSVLRIDRSGNIICIHTLKGMANAAAVSIDSLKNNNILGSIAGDDTIFVLMRDIQSAEKLMEEFKNL